MTNTEFSDSLDTMLNSYATPAQFGEQASRREIVLNEYEKSVLLTQAQDIVVKSYFDAKRNPQGEGFDDSSERQIDFSSLIKIVTISPDKSSTETFDDRGIIYKLPKKKTPENADIDDTTDVLYILNEKLICDKVTGINSRDNKATVSRVGEFTIVPINYKEYDREMSKSYSQPLKKQAWRIFQNNSTGFDLSSEIIPRHTLNVTDLTKIKDLTQEYNEEAELWFPVLQVGDMNLKYKIRYVKRPRPIILENLPNGLEIDGESKESTCELNPILHADILNKAVELAIATRGGIPQQAQAKQ